MPKVLSEVEGTKNRRCFLINRRGVEQWQLAGLIIPRSGVRIPPPQPFFAQAKNVHRSLSEDGHDKLIILLLKKHRAMNGKPTNLRSFSEE